MTNKKDLLKNYKAMDETENVVLADRRVVKARGCGNVTLGARGMARCFRLWICRVVPIWASIASGTQGMEAFIWKWNLINEHPDNEMITDILTKPWAKPQFMELRELMGLDKIA